MVFALLKLWAKWIIMGKQTQNKGHSLTGQGHTLPISNELLVNQSGDSWLEINAWGEDKPGISLEFVSCFGNFSDRLQILDMCQISVEQMCCLYFHLSIKEGAFLDILKAILLAGAVVNYQVDYKINSASLSTTATSMKGGSNDMQNSSLPIQDEQEIFVASLSKKSKNLSPVFLSLVLQEFDAYSASIQSIYQEEIQLQCGAILQNVEIKLSFPSLTFSNTVSVIWDLKWMKTLYKRLEALCWQHETGIVLRKDDLIYRANEKTLVVFGLNETLIEQEMIDEMLLEIGLIPSEYEVEGESSQTNFQRKLSQLSGQSNVLLTKVLTRLTLTEGAAFVCHSLKKMGYKLALITQGFDFASSYFGNKLGFDCILSNHLEEIDGKLTGRVSGESIGVDTIHMMDPLRKVDWLHLLRDKECIPRENVIVIGDYRHGDFLYESCGFRVYFNA
ncbi:phosphoserine phosphatase, partial [Cardiosporidium cionae]